MADMRFPERYLMDRRVNRLTDVDFRSFVVATAWSVSNRTDGCIEQRDLNLIAGFTPGSVPALVDTGLWLKNGTGWVIEDYERTQTSRADFEVLDNARRADREKKARATAHKRGDHSLCYPAVCDYLPGDAPGEVSRGEHRLGEARQGQAGKDKKQVSFSDSIVDDPPLVADPRTGEISEPVYFESFVDENGRPGKRRVAS